MSKKYNNEVMLGGFIVVAGGLLAYMSVAVGGFNMTSGVHVKARFTNAAGLVKDAAVSVAGVQVGHIEGLAVDHDKAVVSIFLQKDAQIRADVKATVRAKSLLGEKYLELRPQSFDAPLLANGSEIASTQTTVEVDELLASLGPLIKQVDPKDVQIIVHNVAKTLDEEQGSLASAIHNAGAISQQVNDMLTANRQNVDKIAANVASLSSDGSSLLKAKRTEIERTVTRIDHIAGVIDGQAPELTRRASRIAANVDSMTTTLNAQAPTLTRDAGAALKGANTVLSKLPATLDDLAGLGHEAKGTIAKVNPLLDKANSFDEARMRQAIENVLLRTGVKVYIHPLGPNGPSDWQKLPQAETQKP